MFNRKQLILLMVPLIIEQTLTVTVGIADSMMVAAAGEAAVAGVSLVDGINNLMLAVLAALATGGAVVCSQYLGKKRADMACEAAGQLVLAAGAAAVVISAVMFVSNRLLLRLIFGQTEADVMDQAVRYFFWISLTYPFMALYNSAAALFRSMGNSKISMIVSLAMNAVNVCGNALLIFGLHMGVAGAAIATLVSRIVGAAILMRRISSKDYELHVPPLKTIRPDLSMIKKILSIGIPSGMENGMFQFGKIITLGIISAYGTAQILANSVGYLLSMFMIIPGMAVSLAMITVVGQCVGAGKIKEARSYTWLLVAVSSGMIALMSGVILLLRPLLLAAYNMSDEAYQITWLLLTLHAVVGIPLWPLAFNLPNALRAGNDAKFTMIVSLASMWIFRVGFSYLLAPSLAAVGVWIAMFIDWAVRAAVFIIRFKGDKWHSKQLV